MSRRSRKLARVVATAALALGTASATAQPLPDADATRAERGLRHTPFEVNELHGAAGLAPDLERREGEFLSRFFARAEERVALNAEVLRWFASGGRDGLHVESFEARADALDAELDALAPPQRLAAVQALVGQALDGQRRFFRDWQAALREGRPFDSQLGSEYGFHEGLHRSHRKLLQAYAELHALYPHASDRLHRAFYDNLRNLDLR